VAEAFELGDEAFGVAAGEVVAAAQALRPVGGAGGCLADTSQSVPHPVKQGCGRARGLEAPSSVVISPDGRNAYVVDDNQQGLAVLVLR
jgi:hypothetical protein